MRKIKAPTLHVVGQPAVTGPQPPRTLREHGRRLWDQVHAEYDVSDVSGIEFLTLACQALDRAEALAARVEEDGELIRTPNGLRTHPAIREELAARGFVVRTLQKLGLNYEPLRLAPGRPPGR